MAILVDCVSLDFLHFLHFLHSSYVIRDLVLHSLHSLHSGISSHQESVSVDCGREQHTLNLRLDHASTDYPKPTVG